MATPAESTPAMTLIERLRAFEGSDELGNGDFTLMADAARALEAADAMAEAMETEVRVMKMGALKMRAYSAAYRAATKGEG